jgi:hypothetical protein
VVVLIHLNHPEFLFRKSVTRLVYIVTVADWSEKKFYECMGNRTGDHRTENRKKDNDAYIVLQLFFFKGLSPFYLSFLRD